MKTFNLKIGILGGGQLGKMLALAAHNWDLATWILDTSKDFPAGPVCSHFVEGSFKDFNDVYRFGKQVDVLTIEIEHVNTEALRLLEKEGLKIHPSPAKLDIIKDKGLQKEFYLKHQLPTSPFQVWDNAHSLTSALADGTLQYPFVQKSRTAGYDGRGVSVIHSEKDLHLVMDGPSLTEAFVNFDKEIAVIVARNEQGQTATFPPVQMDFNSMANLVEFLDCPADISPEMQRDAKLLATRTIEAFGLCGLLAVEMFLTKEGNLFINEVAPRPHNSGHHTIDSCYTSQYEQHLRAILNLPLGSTRMKTASVMVNLLGEPGFSGPVKYQGLEECLAMEGVKIHLYGKAETRPFRKMGHVTILGEDLQQAKWKAKSVKDILKVVSQ